MKFLDLLRCYQSDLFTEDFDTPRVTSTSESSRGVSGAELSRFAEVLSMRSVYY